MTMLIRRCAWHPKYRGYPLLFGVASWRGSRLVFTHGMCRGCAAYLRHEWKMKPLAEIEPERRRRAPAVPALVPPGAVALVAIAVLLFVARPVDHGDVEMSASPRGVASVPGTPAVATVPAPRP